MQRELPSTAILSVLHSVEIADSTSGPSLGMFIVGKDSGEIFFKWCPYNELIDEARASYIHQIYLEAHRIQKVILIPVSGQEAMDLVVSTIQPPEMHQFRLREDAVESAAQFMQVLAVNSAIATNDAGRDFWRKAALSNATAYDAMKKQLKVYVISCTDGVFDVPDMQIVNQDDVPYVTETAAHDIEARFGLDGAQYLRSPLTVADYKAVVGSSVSFSDFALQVCRRGLSSEMRAIMWPELLGVVPFMKENKTEVLKMRVEEYRSLKLQWESLSPYQVAKVVALRNAFQTIRMDVRRTNTPAGMEEGPFKTMMTDILKTYAVYNSDIRYTQGLNDMLLPFVYIFVSHGLEYAEELAFWCFASFLEHAENCLIDSKLGVNGILVADMPSTVHLIDVYDPDCGQWLREHEMEDLNFMISAAMLYYRRSFDELDLERIWDAAIASKEPRHFFLCFAAALLIFCYPAFKAIDNPCTTRILPICDQIFMKQNVGSVIGLAIHIYQDSPPPERTMPARIETPYSSEYFASPFSKNHEYLCKNDLYI